MGTAEASIAELVRLSRIITCHSSAAATCLLYDLVYSLNDEIVLIWRSADTVPKFLYLVSRYYGLFVQLFITFRIVPPYCRPATIFKMVAIDILTLSVEISLMFRLYALYGQSQSALMLLCTLFSGEILALAILNRFSYKNFLEDIMPFPSDWPIKGCYLTNAPAISHVNWVPVLAFETVLFVMMSVKCYSYRNLHEIPILQRIWRDGTIYYLIILVAIAMCTIPAIMSDSLVSSVADVWVVAIFSYSGTHLLLSVRALVEARNSAEVQTPVISEIVRDRGIDVVNDSDPQPVEAHELLPASCSPEPEGSGIGNRVGSRILLSACHRALAVLQAKSNVKPLGRITRGSFVTSSVKYY